MAFGDKLSFGKKRKVFEVGFQDYGKGYYEAKDESDAMRRAKREYRGTSYAPIYATDYDNVAPGSQRAKELNVSFKNGAMLSASKKFKERFV